MRQLVDIRKESAFSAQHEVFGDRGRHTRLALGASELNDDIPVETELIVQVRPAQASYEDEELPQTDRAPSRPWLGWTVAGVAALRLVLLLVFQA